MAMTPEEKASEELFGLKDFHIEEPEVVRYGANFIRYDYSRATWVEVVQWYRDNPDKPVQVTVMEDNE
jgi:hypothetical protein